MKQLLFAVTVLLSVVCITDNLFAQSTFELPADIQLKSKDDFVKYETTLIEAAQWLENTDLDKDKTKRKKINEFVVQYFSSTPAFTMEFTEELVDLFKKNYHLM